MGGILFSRVVPQLFQQIERGIQALPSHSNSRLPEDRIAGVFGLGLVVDLKAKLDAAQIYHQAEVEEFCEVFNLASQVFGGGQQIVEHHKGTNDQM